VHSYESVISVCVSLRFACVCVCEDGLFPCSCVYAHLRCANLCEPVCVGGVNANLVVAAISL